MFQYFTIRKYKIPTATWTWVFNELPVFALGQNALYFNLCHSAVWNFERKYVIWNQLVWRERWNCPTNASVNACGLLLQSFAVSWLEIILTCKNTWFSNYMYNVFKYEISKVSQIVSFANFVSYGCEFAINQSDIPGKTMLTPCKKEIIGHVVENK